MSNPRGKPFSSVSLPRRLGVRFTLPLLFVLLLFSASMLGMGYRNAREQVFAGAAAYIRQLEAFATLQEAYARQWIEGSVMPIVRALEDAGPERYYAYESQRLRLENAIMAAMPAGQGQMGIRVYLEDGKGGRHGISFARGKAPLRFTPGEDEVRRAFHAVAEDKGAWQTYVEGNTESGGGTKKNLIAQYYTPVFKRNSQGQWSRFGVLAVEVTLSWLADRIHTISTTPDAHIFFMDRDGAWTLPEPSVTAGNLGLSQLHRSMAAKQAGQSLVTWKGQPQVAAYRPLGSGDLMLGIFIPEKGLFGSLDRMVMLFAAAGLSLFLFALLSLRRTTELILRPLRSLSRDADRLSAGDFSYEPSEGAGATAPFSLFSGHPRWPDEPGRLRNASAQLRVALRQRQRDLTLLAATRERLFGEIALAGKLQHNLRRGSSEVPENILLAAELRPAGHIAQDILDCFPQNPDTLCLVAASVTAHGVPAALLMDRVIPLLRELLVHGASPAEALKNANIIIHSYAPIDKTEISAFVSVFIGALRATDGVLTWAGAGKNPPYRVFAGTAEALPWSGDLPLGVKRNAAYQNQTLALRPGETLFLCGGRLLAMPSPLGTVFGEDRLLSLLKAFTGTPAKLLETVLADCLAHTQSETPPEDIAVLAARWLGERQV
ncbi:SpoIIE family protein phosphatase [Desulfovibrio sp. OttesenSCG-928-G15]|nr:SpoIIE family protein phosphatase [Desulfovibrio sp. OttesenSCG-928-G15]